MSTTRGTLTEIEDILEYFRSFDDIVKTLTLSQGPQRFLLIPAMMWHNPWFDIAINYGANQSQEELEDCIKKSSFFSWRKISP